MTDHRRKLQLRAAIQPAQIRTATYQGQPHLIVPVVAMVGDTVIRPVSSEGRSELVPSRVLAAAPESWNGRPIVADHPEGGFDTANKPATLEAMKMGEVFNARFEDGRLKMDAWIDITAAKQIPGGLEVLDRAQRGEPIEVSIGAYILASRETGTRDGQTFEFVWQTIFPDHLAMGLAGSEGACSVEMGCGAPRAAKKGQDVEPNDGEAGVLRNLATQILDALGMKIPVALKAHDDEDASEPSSSATPTGAASCPCNKTGDGTDPEKGAAMSASKTALVGRLIANARSPFTEDNTATLEALSEEQLEALDEQFAEPEEGPESSAEPAEPATETETKTEEEPKPTPETVEVPEGFALVPEEDLEDMRAAAGAWKRQRDAEKAAKVASLTAAQEVYSEAELKAMSLESLEKVEALCAAALEDAGFSGRGVPAIPAAASSANPAPKPYDIALERRRKEGAA